MIFRFAILLKLLKDSSFRLLSAGICATNVSLKLFVPTSSAVDSSGLKRRILYEQFMYSVVGPILLRKNDSTFALSTVYYPVQFVATSELCRLNLSEKYDRGRSR